MKIGKRDAFWLTISLAIIAILFLIRIFSHDGFSDSGKPVWKSANLGSDRQNSTKKVGSLHSPEETKQH